MLRFQSLGTQGKKQELIQRLKNDKVGWIETCKW
jgi:hypothetical protein